MKVAAGPICVVLDTNILHQEGLSSIRMQRLSELTKRECLKLIIPELVINEYETALKQKAHQHLNDSVKNLSSVSKTVSSTPTRVKVENVIDQIAAIKKEIDSRIDQDIHSWLELNKAEVLGLANVDIKLVFDDYFLGQNAFSGVKERKDIPDAVIYHNISTFLEGENNTWVICKDGNLKKALKELDSLKILDDLKSFFEAPDIKTLYETKVIPSESEEVILSYFDEAENIQKLVSLMDSESEPSYLYMEDYEISNAEIIGIWHFGHRLEIMAEGFVLESIEILDKKYSENSILTLNFAMNALGGLYYCTDYGSLLELQKDPERIPEFEYMNGDGICDISENVRVRLTGSIELAIDDNNSHADFNNERLNKIIESPDVIQSIRFISANLLEFV